MSNKAMDGAERKGREAAAAGKPRINPYPDKRGDYNNSATFSRAFQNRWFEGYDKYKRELPQIAAYHGDVDGDGALA